MHVLIIDDDLGIRELLAGSLTDMGHVVTAASSATDAFRLLSDLPRFDVILLDLRLPVVSGWEFVVMLRELPSYANTPVVAVSASELGRATMAQFDAFVPKPYRLEDLEEAMNRVVAARGQAGAVLDSANGETDAERRLGERPPA